MATEQDTNTEYQNTQVVESLISSGESGRPSFQENNGHFTSSPEEDTFTPTSVIYFKEALTSASVQFAKKTLNPPATVKYEFHIETTKKTK
ncbi:protein RUFY3 isoform X1, partial [Tachysurus ichikawai]